MKRPGVNIVSLGCAKNLVDSEQLSRQLTLNGYDVAFEKPDEREVVIINTCGFINDAKQESIETILEYARRKTEGKLKSLYVIGCLSQRYKTELEQEIPEADGFYGVYEQEKILKDLNAAYYGNYSYQRNLATPKHYAYLKIAEGCDRKCSFCSIPYIKGSYRSKPLKEIEREAGYLSEKGVQEVNLIAQDLTYYGYDLYKKSTLSEVLETLSVTDTFPWIRLLYTYPAGFPEKVIHTMARQSNICSYLDIPFQHISDKVLKKMRRGINSKQTYKLIDLIKKHIPEITLRTTLLVGHPGETEEDFRHLMEFVREVQFDRLGVFVYSEEEGTYSALRYEDDIPQHIKKQRSDEIMQLQQDISYRKNLGKVGKTLPVLIDREDEQYYYGRTEADAPEVDNEVIIEKTPDNSIAVGNFYRTKIHSAAAYDLFGEVVGHH
ncbi:MAG: 30S ribosomal protein S12 methylthiotransferase RimO [Bacteroidales bacterium]|nr:30S ribosomal protein S12 methylthiotransferase RimO [Bacteroidales bacterium]MBS3773728.1 30S ribosomal protein S12 methylthiotransferase RimO [Bacteroidales bacterium]